MIDMEQQEYRINFCCVVIFRICLYFVYTHSHTHAQHNTEGNIEKYSYICHVYLPFLHSCKPFSFVYVALCTCTRIRTHTDTHTRPQLQLLQAISNMRFCLHSYVCMQVCVVVCRTRPTFCIFLFWYRFQNKTTHFPRCKRNSDSDSDFSSFSSLFLSVVLFAGFLFAPQLHNICSAHFVYTILFIYFTASSEFYFAPRARTDTHSIPHSHTHAH